MPFPESDRVVFDRNPITEVICQLRFPPILQISAAPPAEFQNAVRDRYPLFEQMPAPGVPKEMLAVLARIPGILEIGGSQFLSESRDQSIVLNTNFLAVRETKYVQWSDLRVRVIEAQAALEGVYKPAFYDRIGLRYVNTIRLRELGLSGRKWRELLNSAFLSVMGASTVADHVIGLATQAVIDLAHVIPGARVASRFGLRPDVPDGSEFYIDNDFYFEGRKESNDVISILNEFNRLDGNLFRWAIDRNGPLWNALGPTTMVAAKSGN
jgi:uncharacterized protein (TIGR04255 family)